MNPIHLYIIAAISMIAFNKPWTATVFILAAMVCLVFIIGEHA